MHASSELSADLIIDGWVTTRRCHDGIAPLMTFPNTRLGNVRLASHWYYWSLSSTGEKREMKTSILFASTLLACTSAFAQTTDGYGTTVRIPVAVSSSTYSTDIFVHNGGGIAASVAVTYYGASGTPEPGSRPCTTLAVPAGTTVHASLATLCSLPVGPGSNYGQLSLHEQSAQNIPISAYTRVEAVTTAQGFSIEGFKIGSLMGANQSVVTGLRQQSAAPGYQSNCFIGSIDEPVTVTWSLRTNAGAALGSQQTTSLASNEMVRVLDVFSAVGAPAGSYSNVQAVFSEDTIGSNPGFVAFCTVQENGSFDADFRIAKEVDPRDDRSSKLGVSSSDALGTVLGLLFGSQDVFGLYLQHPDWVQCALSGTSVSDLEMRLEDPQGNVVAGGDGVFSFGKVYLGERSTRNNGVNGLWKLKVESNNPLILLPINYSVICESGNGSNPPLLVGEGVDQF